jgi:hypothetical protein
MQNAGMLEIMDLPAGITVASSQSERSSAYPLDTVITSLLLHDLRSPLSAICWCAEMLLAGNLGPADSRRVASNMHRAAGRMRELIADAARTTRWRADTDERAICARSSWLHAKKPASPNTAGLTSCWTSLRQSMFPGHPAE